LSDATIPSVGATSQLEDDALIVAWNRSNQKILYGMSMGMKFFFESSWYAVVYVFFIWQGWGQPRTLSKGGKKMNFRVLQSLQD
jgi:hypothetical protein